MVEGISADADAHPCRPHVVVGIQDEEVVPCQMHNHQVPDDTKEGLVFVHHQKVIHEAEIVLQPFTGEPLEPLCQELAPSPYQFLLLRRLCCQDLLADIVTGPVGHTLRIIGDAEESFCLTVEVCQIKHAEELCNLDTKWSTLQVTVYHLIYKVTQLPFLEFIRNFLFEDGMVHHREIMMDIKGDVVPDIQLWISVQFIPDEAEKGMRSQSRPYCRCSPGDVVIHRLFVWQYGSGLRVVVADGSLSQLPVLFVEDMSLLIALRLKGLIDDVGEYQTDILIKICFVPADIGPLMLAVRIVVESIPCVLLRLILPTVLDSTHCRGLE